MTMKIQSPIQMQITTRVKSSTDRKRRYRERGGDELRAKEANRKRGTRAAAIPEFIAVDSEGIGPAGNHRAVLLGVGQEQYIAKDLSKGLHWREVFEFLYRQFESKSKAA